MADALFYLVSSFWLGALHAATPGHGKTIAAAYIVGVRGRPVDAVVLGLFVTLSHTIGIILVAILATMGATWGVPQRVEAYLAAGTGLLVVAIGLWMLRTQSGGLFPPVAAPGDTDHRHDHDHEDPHEHGPHTHTHEAGAVLVHRHGWGPAHSHAEEIERITRARPSLLVLVGLAIAGGLLPDPGALAILLAAIAGGKLVVGLFTVLVFSVGFASVLVVVGVVAARVGQLVLTWLESRWIAWLQVAAALLILGVGLVLTVNAFRTLAALQS
jgi:nickel/cobalt transporter (NicO) family protein